MSYKFTHRVILTLAVIATGACNSLLSVDNPGRVPDTQLDDPALAGRPVPEAVVEAVDAVLPELP